MFWHELTSWLWAMTYDNAAIQTYQISSNLCRNNKFRIIETSDNSVFHFAESETNMHSFVRTIYWYRWVDYYYCVPDMVHYYYCVLDTILLLLCSWYSTTPVFLILSTTTVFLTLSITTTVFMIQYITTPVSLIQYITTTVFLMRSITTTVQIEFNWKDFYLYSINTYVQQSKN